jgi:hypothetical protein
LCEIKIIKHSIFDTSYFFCNVVLIWSNKLIVISKRPHKAKRNHKIGLNPPKLMFKYAVTTPIMSSKNIGIRKKVYPVLIPSVSHDIPTPPSNE